MNNPLGGGHTDLAAFKADFWQDRLYIAEQEYPVGHFTVEILNERYNFGNFRDYPYIRDMFNELRLTGSFTEKQYFRARDELYEMLGEIKKISILSFFNTQYEELHINRLFQEVSFRYLLDYFQLQEKLRNNPKGLIIDRYVPTEKDERTISEAQYLLADIENSLIFYSSLFSDLFHFYCSINAFAEQVAKLNRPREGNLIELANQIFEGHYDRFHKDGQRNARVFKADAEYFALKQKNSYLTAQSLYFTRMIDFLTVDFFEGLRNGHFPKQCAVCGKYFLMTTSINQIYCNGYAPNDPKGRPCRKVGIDRKNEQRKKETRDNNPIQYEYNKRRQSVRQDFHRGKISAEFAELAKVRLEELKFKAIRDNEYFLSGGYLADMSNEKLYAYVRINQGLAQ